MPKIVPGYKYYVYLHRHPLTHEVVYVGKGTAGRAWASGHSFAKAHRGIRGARTKNHQNWIQNLLDAGYAPDDYVVILAKTLDDDTARDAERMFIEYFKVLSKTRIFNECYRSKKAAISVANVKLAKKWFKKGLRYSEISKKLGCGTMTVWRAVHGHGKMSYGVGNAL